jgi:predicted transcriptional regulator
MSRLTKLEAFLKANGIKPADLARESGYSRQHLLQVRLGKRDPTRKCIAAITQACRTLSEKNLNASQLFTLDTP